MYTMRHERISDDIRRIYQAVPYRGAMPGLPLPTEVARRLYLPEMRDGRKAVANWGNSVQMRELRTSGFSHCRDDFSGHTQAVAKLVHGDLVGYHAEERRECGRLTADSRLGQLSDRLDVASQNPHGNGQSRQNKAVRYC